jgi:hypothetical protein
MASLTEVYRGGGGGGLQRLYAGVALFGVGAILVTTGLLVVSTELGATLGLGQFEARELAGVLGGIGFPAVLLGTMVALPRASRRLQAAAAVGALLSLVGVGLFVGLAGERPDGGGLSRAVRAVDDEVHRLRERTLHAP